MRLKLFIPSPDSTYYKVLAQGSALVGDPTDSRFGECKVLVYYEGNIYGACNLNSFAEKATCAAGRLIERYPTIAKVVLPREELIEVGFMEEGYRVTLEREDLIAAWEAGEPVSGR